MRLNTRYFAVLGLVLFAYIVYRVGLADILAILSQINKTYFIFALLFTPLIVSAKGFKWWLVIRAHHIKYPLLMTIRVWLIGVFVGTITPARAGELIKVFYVNEKTSTGRAISTVFVDRVVDMFALFFLAISGALSLFRWFGQLYTYVFIAISVGVAVLLLLTERRFMRLFMKPILHTIIPKSKRRYFKDSFNDFYSALHMMKSRKKFLASLLVLTVFIWVITISQGFLMVKSLNLPVTYWFFLSISPIVILITILPVSVLGLGTRDASMIFFFSLLGISAASAVAYSLLDVLMLWTFALLGAAVWLTDRKEMEL